MLGQFLKDSLMEIRFIYGLVFFTLGMAIVLRPRRGSVYYLAPALSWLAAFGLSHAVADWVLLMVPHHQAQGHHEFAAQLAAVRALGTVISFGFLMQFGLTLLLEHHPWQRWSGILPVTLAFVLVLVVLSEYSPHTASKYMFTRIAGRYFLGFPASVLSAWGLLTQVNVLRRDRLGKHVVHLFGAASCFVLYALVAGLVTPEASFFPASVINEEWFFETLGIPVELIRGAAMAGVTLFTVRLLDIFSDETQRRLKAVEQDRALLRERERIARELHDGIMQTLYGTGLGLKQMMSHCNAQSQDGPILAELNKEIGRAIVQMRRFVLDLKEESVTAPELLEAIQSLARDIGQFAGLGVSLEVDTPLSADVKVPGGVREEVLAIVREGFSNIVRHAQANEANLLVSVEDDTLLLRISDSGCGFDTAAPTGGRGLDAARERVEAMGGFLQVISQRGQGTQLVAHIPLTPRRSQLRHKEAVR